MARKKFSYGAPPYRVNAEVMLIGEDLLVILHGGDKPHIGSIAVALPRPSLKNKKHTSATSSVYNFLGHKDDVVARKVAETLSAKLNKKVVVTTGIHVERITDEGIAQLIDNSDKLTKRIYEAIEKKS